MAASAGSRALLGRRAAWAATVVQVRAPVSVFVHQCSAAASAKLVQPAALAAGPAGDAGDLSRPVVLVVRLRAAAPKPRTPARPPHARTDRSSVTPSPPPFPPSRLLTSALEPARRRPHIYTIPRGVFSGALQVRAAITPGVGITGHETRATRGESDAVGLHLPGQEDTRRPRLHAPPGVSEVHAALRCGDAAFATIVRAHASTARRACRCADTLA